MKNSNKLLVSLLLIGCCAPIFALDRTQLVVWANEAIVAAYTFDAKNFAQQQKESAKYFTYDAWSAYSKALTESKILETIQKNNYEVTSVATQPPVLTTLDSTHWQVTMSLLVDYKNTQQQQQQNLKINLGFTSVPEGQGVRGLAITSLKSTAMSPPCECKNQSENLAN